MTLNFPVSCCGIEYVAKATGPMKIFTKYLSKTSYICTKIEFKVSHCEFFLGFVIEYVLKIL